VGDDFHQLFRFELAQCLAQRSPAYTKLLAQFTLDKAAARSISTRGDAVSYGVFYLPAERIRLQGNPTHNHQ
jgi:hypothetical protein